MVGTFTKLYVNLEVEFVTVIVLASVDLFGRGGDSESCDRSLLYSTMIKMLQASLKRLHGKLCVWEKLTHIIIAILTTIYHTSKHKDIIAC